MKTKINGIKDAKNGKAPKCFTKEYIVGYVEGLRTHDIEFVTGLCSKVGIRVELPGTVEQITAGKFEKSTSVMKVVDDVKQFATRIKTVINPYVSLYNAVCQFNGKNYEGVSKFSGNALIEYWYKKTPVIVEEICL